jgi:hypothetical protein
MPDERAVCASLHEGAHVATAHILHWPLLGASRTCGWQAVTHVDPRLDGDLLVRGIECAMILLSPFLLGAVGTSDDLRKVAALAEASVPVEVARARTERMIRTDLHARLRWAVADALMSRPELSAEDLAWILR